MRRRVPSIARCPSDRRPLGPRGFPRLNARGKSHRRVRTTMRTTERGTRAGRTPGRTAPGRTRWSARARTAATAGATVACPWRTTSGRRRPGHGPRWRRTSRTTTTERSGRRSTTTEPRGSDWRMPGSNEWCTNGRTSSNE